MIRGTAEVEGQVADVTPDLRDTEKATKSALARNRRVEATPLHVVSERVDEDQVVRKRMLRGNPAPG